VLAEPRPVLGRERRGNEGRPDGAGRHAIGADPLFGEELRETAGGIAMPRPMAQTLVYKKIEEKK
jgi:hypothetical protein